MRIFLAGIMQGSHREPVFYNQTYRDRLQSLLRKHFPKAEIYDPRQDHHNSLCYDDRRGRQVFLTHNRMCGEADVLLAYIPEASMGTAIEMWEAHRNGRVVLSISPLEHNWAVKFLSHAVYSDVSCFTTALRSGEVAQKIAEVGE